MKKYLFIFISTLLTLNASTINLAVAANVSYAIDELKKEFIKNNKNADIKVTIGSSGQLYAQIKRGAKFDIFLSANMKYPNRLYKQKIAITKPIVYTKGSIALVLKKDLKANSLEVLKSKKIKHIAIANPKTAPYGVAAKEALQNANLYNKLKNKFIYGMSIAQTLSYTLKAADAGIVAKSALFSKKLKRYNLHYIDINPLLYTPISQGMTILKNAKNKKPVKEFYDFLLSKTAKKIFKEYGYIIK